MRQGALLSVLLLLLGGCASSIDSSRTLARETLTEVVTYEKSVRDLHDAINTNFADQLDQTQEGLTVVDAAAHTAARNALAVEAADAVLEKGFHPADLKKFIIASTSAGNENIDALDARMTDLRAKSAVTAALTDDATKKLKAVRQSLEKLQGKQKRSDELKAYHDLLTAARNALKEQE